MDGHSCCAVYSLVFFNPTMVNVVLPSDIKTLSYVISDKSLTADKIASALLFARSNKSLSVKEGKNDHVKAIANIRYVVCSTLC